MSEQDRFDWNDDMEMDSMAQDLEDFEDFKDHLDGFEDFEDLSDYEDHPEMDAPAQVETGSAKGAGLRTAAAAPSRSPETHPSHAAHASPPVMVKRRRGISATGLGFLFTGSVLVAGVGIGGAILLAEGVPPRTLWQPDNLLQVDQLLNFTENPLNILYMVTMGVVFLALLGTFKMARAAMEANERTSEAEVMLDRVTALSLDRQEEWQSQEFKSFPPAEAFVARTLGAWRLQEARQKRLMGVEGELHRLELALNKNSREDLTGRYDHPAVGRLADEIIRYFDARDLAEGKLKDYKSRDLSHGAEILDLLQESRQWNCSTLDNLGVQCTALDELAGQMGNLARHLESSLAEFVSNDGMTDIIEGIRKDLDGHTANTHLNHSPMSALNDLVDRGSKLAFQIAMEVARLGPRGERLLPMSQSLEDLTTGFRKLADQVNNQAGDPAHAQTFRSVYKKLETLAALITEDDLTHWRDLADEIPDFGPAAARISGTLTSLADGFNEQEERFVSIGSSFATMTGAEFDSTSIPRKESSEAPVSSLGLTRSERPHWETSGTGAPIEMDPFTSSDVPLMSPDDQPADPDFPSSVIPGAGAQAPAQSPFRETPGPGFDNSTRFSLDIEGTGDMPLSEDEERVYDLGDFGAAPANEEPVFQEDDQVFEMSDFGGMSLEQDSASNDEEVFDLADFGMTPVAAEATGADDEVVHDLSDFGAMPLDLAVGLESDAAPDDDMVFDLSDFGAKPLK